MSLTAPAPSRPCAPVAAGPTGTGPTGTGPATSPYPLPDAGWGAVDALTAVEAARDRLPVALPEPSVVSALTTVVLRAGAHAVKVYPPGTDAVHLDRIGHALSGSASALAASSPAVTTPWGVVTLSSWLPTTRPVTWPELGRLLRGFHDEHADAALPGWTPLSRLPAQVAGLPAGQAWVLLTARQDLLAALGSVRSEAGVGLIHGDVSPANVLRRHRRPVLIDLDWAARAPREYDLASAARRVRNGEITAREYAGFCAAYGFDVASWPGLPLLDRIADLGGVAFRLWDDRRRGNPLDWLPAELRHWRTPL